MEIQYLKTSIESLEIDIQRNMKQIGYGIEAKVYSDGRYAYKICGYRSAYIGWLFFLKENGYENHPNVPKIEKIIVGKGGNRCVVMMELLKPINCDKLKKEYDTIEKTYDRYRAKPPKKVRKKLNEVILSIRNFSKQRKNGIILDMHLGNVMARGETLVITDPVI